MTANEIRDLRRGDSVMVQGSCYTLNGGWRIALVLRVRTVEGGDPDSPDDTYLNLQHPGGATFGAMARTSSIRAIDVYEE